MNDVDLVIIGGGIHGAGVALAAAARGHSVRLLEKSALASGTSSRSSKLIHGGLRYLESGQISLVRECLTERQILLRIAPDLVRLKPFFIPVYKQTSRRPWQIRSGLTLYALLAGLDKSSRYQKLTRSEWASLDGLNTENLLVVYRYYDAQTDDAALTRAVMQTAQRYGAELCTPAELLTARLDNDGVAVVYRYQNREFQCRAGAIINAAGPWVNKVLDRVTPTVAPLPVDLVQGAHIVVDGRLQQGLYYVEAPADKRAVFVMPWQNRILVGTTETLFHGNPDRVQPLTEEIRYLRDTLGHYFSAYRNLDIDQIHTAFAGLRVLPRAGTDAFHRPRETTLLQDRDNKPRLVNIYGGKLTAYRVTAEKVMACLRETLPPRQAFEDTARIALR